jgi:hypothetical protein
MGIKYIRVKKGHTMTSTGGTAAPSFQSTTGNKELQLQPQLQHQLQYRHQRKGRHHLRSLAAGSSNGNITDKAIASGTVSKVAAAITRATAFREGEGVKRGSGSGSNEAVGPRSRKSMAASSMANGLQSDLNTVTVPVTSSSLSIIGVNLSPGEWLLGGWVGNHF